MPTASRKSPGYPQLLTWLHIGGSPDLLPLGFIICSNYSQKSGKYLVYQFIKRTIKDTDKSSGEEIHRVRTGRVPNTAASVLMELGSVTFFVHGFVYQHGRPQTPYPWDFYGSFLT